MVPKIHNMLSITFILKQYVDKTLASMYTFKTAWKHNYFNLVVNFSILFVKDTPL